MSTEEIKAGLYECYEDPFTMYFNFFLGNEEAIEVGWEQGFEVEWSCFEEPSDLVKYFMGPEHLELPKEYML